jgi:Holliday junction resolvase-like predicted endonuclease
MEKLNSRRIGSEGEKIAMEWISKKGWSAVTSNFRKRGFEIDLVALDDKNILRFIEVKNVVNGSCLDVSHSVYNRNIGNYFKGVEAFLLWYPGFSGHEMSMDVIIINKGEILYYENVSGDMVL